MSYEAFLASKHRVVPNAGIEVAADAMHPSLFPFQRDVTRWALRKGRSALFLDTGMGKTFCQLEWARLAAQRALILAPLAVAQQTVAEGVRWGIPVTYARSQADAPIRGITIANYEMLSHFDPAAFGAVVLDESSCLKAFSGVTKRALVKAFRDTPMRLCCTATPAPNDTVELCNHADFLGIMSQAEMISTFFTPKGQDSAAGNFRLKGHARDAFYRWLASWSMSLRMPSDLGYSDEGYVLPPLNIKPLVVESDWAPEGKLFLTKLHGVVERAGARRATIPARVTAAAQTILAEPGQQWLVWCGLNEEGRQLGRRLLGAVVIEGADPIDRKAAVLGAFSRGEIPTLITKSSIAGFGLNLQSCARMLFLGIGDSYEQYYQAIRRCWRFGQSRPVHAYIVVSDAETDVYNNVLRKEKEAAEWGREMIRHVGGFEKEELEALGPRQLEYDPQELMVLPEWLESARTKLEVVA